MPNRFSGSLPPQVSTSRTAPPQVGSRADEEVEVDSPPASASSQPEPPENPVPPETPEVPETPEGETPEVQESAEAPQEGESSTDVQEPVYSDEEIAEMKGLYEGMNMEDLKEEARSRDLTGYSQLNKADLVEFLSTNDRAQTVAPEESSQ